MKKLIALLLAVLLMAGLMAGCGNGGEETSTQPSGGTTTSTEPTTAPSYEGPVEVDETVTYELPLVDDIYTFEWWVANPDSFDGFSGMQDNTFYQWMEEETNVHIQFNHPATGSESESFQTMVLSGDYPDFVSNPKGYYTGGIDKAINDGFIQPLNDYIDLAPNYKYFVYEQEQTFIQAVSDEGNLWGIHHINNVAQGSWIGLGIRQDWLDKAGIALETAETIDGLEQILTTFTNEYTYDNSGALWLSGGNASSASSGINAAYGIINLSMVGSFLNVDGVATYSPLQPGMKDYVAKMADWYAKGLINKNYIAEASWSTPESYWTNGEMGVGELMYTQNLMYKDAAAVSELNPDPDFDVVAIHAPLLNEGDDISTDVHIRNSQSIIRPGSSIGITTQCTNLELALAYWNHAWSEEGRISANWGQIEGEYGDVNAHYYIDETDANGDGHTYCYQPAVLEACGTVSRVQCKHCVYNGPVYNIWSREYCVLTPEQIYMTEVWDMASDDWMWPEGVTLTDAEGDEASGILATCNTLVNTWMAEVITGVKSADTYETDVVQACKDNGIDTAIAHYQAALTRYNARIEYMDK